MTDEHWVNELREAVSSGFDYTQSLPDDELLGRIEEAVFALARDHPLSARRKEALVKRVFHSFRGLDVLQPLLDDPSVTEIMVNSHREIFYEQAGAMHRYDAGFERETRLEDLIQSIVSKVNRTVNESQPIVDARLMDGSRVHVVLPPVALKGPSLTIRKFPDRPLSMRDLIAGGAISQEAAVFLERLVKAKYNIFISGGTGSGKTTFLNALLGWIPDDERIITIEDSAELQIRQIPNLVSLETRNANTEGKGEIGMRELIRAALRMRPNRIIVGEVRGAEALEMLQAMNTGHDGSLSTGHANSARDMLSRLETMVMTGASLPVEVVRKQIASALDVMVHLSRLRDRSRRVTEICEVSDLVNGEVRLRPLFVWKEWKESNRTDDGACGCLHRTEHDFLGTGKLRLAGLDEPGEADGR